MCLLLKGCDKFHLSAPCFSICYDYLRLVEKQMPCQLLYSSSISLLLLFSDSDGEMGSVPLPPNPFPVPEAEPVACTTVTFPAPSSTPVLVLCLIAFLENRITLSKARRIQAHT